MTPKDAPDEPLWRQVLTDIERRIGGGEIGPEFPTDRELVEHYDVSRHTVREAVRHLKARGVIERERGRGSFVREASLAQPFGTLYSLFRAVERQGLEQTSDVLALGFATDERAASRFGVDAGEEFFHLERLRYADGQPLALDTVWLPADIGRPLLDVDFTRTALYDQLETHSDIRVVGGDETIHAVAATDDMAEVLDLDDDEALLRIERLGRTADGGIVECRVTLVRGSRFALASQWPQAGDAVAPVVMLG